MLDQAFTLAVYNACWCVASGTKVRAVHFENNVKIVQKIQID